jgi:hypothetical protein
MQGGCQLRALIHAPLCREIALSTADQRAMRAFSIRHCYSLYYSRTTDAIFREWRRTYTATGLLLTVMWVTKIYTIVSLHRLCHRITASGKRARLEALGRLAGGWRTTSTASSRSLREQPTPCMHAYLSLQIDQFADADGPMSEEVFEKRCDILTRMIDDEFNAIRASVVVRRRQPAPVLGRLFTWRQILRRGSSDLTKCRQCAAVMHRRLPNRAAN